MATTTEKEEVNIYFGDISVAYHVSTGILGQKHICRKCKQEFPSNNRLYTHLKGKKCRLLLEEKVRTAP